MIDTVIVIAKEPVPGRVKTRLCPPLSPAECAELAAAYLAETLQSVMAWPARRRVLFLDGEVPPGTPEAMEIWPQPDGELDVRLAAAFARAEGRTLLVGMDTPTMEYADVAEIFASDAWADADAYLGPSLDGGFWALAMLDPRPGPLLGVPMSTDLTGRRQLHSLRAAGLRTRLLPTLRDVDTCTDAAAAAAAAPDRRSAALWRGYDVAPSERRIAAAASASGR